MNARNGNAVEQLLALNRVAGELLPMLRQLCHIHEQLYAISVVAADELLTPERIIGGD